jgi:hypothetical protein
MFYRFAFGLIKTDSSSMRFHLLYLTVTPSILKNVFSRTFRSENTNQRYSTNGLTKPYEQGRI